MKITKTLVTTLEIEKAELLLLDIEYQELTKLLNRKRKTEEDFTFNTIHEIIQNLLN